MENSNMDRAAKIAYSKAKKGFICDMDGVICLSAEPIEAGSKHLKAE